MSENPNPHFELEKLQLSPEHQRAFRGVYSHLMELTNQRGDPVMVTSYTGAGFITYNERHFAHTGEKFDNNAKKATAQLQDKEGNLHRSWATMLDEKGVHDFRRLGGLEVYEGGSSHPADIYNLYPDMTIEHLKRTDEDDGQDEEDYPINWREHIQHLGQLDVQEMEDLQHSIETARA